MNVADDMRASFSNTKIVMDAIIVVNYFQNHYERAVCIMYRLGYISQLSVLRFNRCLHQLAHLICEIARIPSELLSSGKIPIIGVMPLPALLTVRPKK